jgi:lipid-binding SYLF domain-containing protein
MALPERPIFRFDFFGYGGKSRRINQADVAATRTFIRIHDRHPAVQFSTRSRTMLRKSMTAFMMGVVFALTANFAFAADAAQLKKDSFAALNDLYVKVPETKDLETKAKGILVFPHVTKAGVGIGGLYGQGVLIVNKKVVGYYSTKAASIGLQLGAQRYGYAMFLMSDKAMEDMKSAHGFEVGVGPTVTVIEAGMAKNITTATVQPDVYAFIFSSKGLMAGITLEGSKITKIKK